MPPIAYLLAAAVVAAPPQVEPGDEGGREAPIAAPEADGASAQREPEAPPSGPDQPSPSDASTSPEADENPSGGSIDAELPSESDADPLPRRPSAELIKRRRAEARRGRALTIAGATLTGLGLAGRVGFGVFLATVADLAPREPFGQWSLGPIFMATTFTNVPTLAGIGLLGGGSYYQARAHGRRFAHPSSRRTKRTAWGLLGGGLGLWGLSRALFVPWTRACQSNACAYGYLEPTYYVSAGLVLTGVVLLAREAGFRRAEAEEAADYIKIRARRPTPTLSPIVAPGFQGLSLSGRF